MKIAARISAPLEERPLELLYACHEKVRRFTTLAVRLAEHVDAHGTDAEAQEAATGILRYFEQALPLHHIDEEVDVFPALRGLHDVQLERSINALSAEHLRLDTQWEAISPWLRRIAAAAAPGQTPAGLADFAAAYAAHTEREEREVFAAITRLPEIVVNSIGARMRARRGA
ncbi:MAG TPA: hemerythrin domain-containing protein [Roseateles sp.]|nr:hemerythrin domain-containing protein [Roseateles sp.]HWT53825.1 hemerythrin domain-containing protein [Rhodocyclaceae bacterium]